jgi:nitroreductase
MSNIQTLIEQRVSSNHFDTDRTLAPALIHELVRLATLSPSAYNFQNWKFVAVTTPEAKQRLKPVAYGQQKVVDAAVTFIVCGTLDGHQGLAAALQPSVDAGIVDPGAAGHMVQMAQRTHQDNPQMQRDEAFRSASLAAMTLMLAAEGLGLTSCPMSGFDPQGVAQAFQLAAHEVPVVLVAIGYASTQARQQKRRKPVADVLAMV